MSLKYLSTFDSVNSIHIVAIEGSTKAEEILPFILKILKEEDTIQSKLFLIDIRKLLIEDNVEKLKISFKDNMLLSKNYSLDIALLYKKQKEAYTIIEKLCLDKYINLRAYNNLDDCLSWLKSFNH